MWVVRLRAHSRLGHPPEQCDPRQRAHSVTSAGAEKDAPQRCVEHIGAQQYGSCGCGLKPGETVTCLWQPAP
eukprot:8966372-Alexandrium_andersonii.AAC.1